MTGVKTHEQTVWRLQDAKARLSELVRKSRAGKPQHVTVHGRKAVVVLSEDEYRRLTGNRTGTSLVKALAGSPLSNLEFGKERIEGPVRDVEL